MEVNIHAFLIRFTSWICIGNTMVKLYKFLNSKLQGPKSVSRSDPLRTGTIPIRGRVGLTSFWALRCREQDADCSRESSSAGWLSDQGPRL
jgi:hypothetical protein